MTNTAPMTRFPYQDPSLSVDQRVEDLLARMDLDDKAALMFHPILPFGDFDAPGIFGLPSARVLLDRQITHFNILQAPSAREIAEWTNSVQEIASRTRLGIPVTFSTDPRHSFSDNPATSLLAGPFSQWPEMLGFGALNDPELVERFADTIRREYLAVGIRTALHPQVDIATEPRWSRASTTFGSDADIVGDLGAAYVRGLQGAAIGTSSRCPEWRSTSPAAARRRTAKTRTSPTAASRSTRAACSSTTSSRSRSSSLRASRR